MPALLLSVLALSTIAMSGWPWRWFARNDDWRHVPQAVRQGFARIEEGGKLAGKPLVIWRDEDGPRPSFLTPQENYQEAIRRFHEAPQYHPVVYWLTGNAEYLAGDIPAAVLEYRRGLAGAPTNQRLRHALEFVRSGVDYPIPESRPSMPSSWVCPRRMSDAACCLMLILHVYACLCATSWLTTRKSKWAKRATISMVLAAIAGLTSISLAEWARHERQSQVAVINEDSMPLREGNGTSYPTLPGLPYVHRGMEARVVHVRGSWLQLEFPGGYIGWVPAEKVLVGLF